MQYDYDYVIIGSGFGGSVSALRLSEKGYRVLVVERGKWYRAEDFAESNWNLNKWLWLPELRLFGIMKMTIYNHIGIISGAGVGGGSLVYANTLPTPKSPFFNQGTWAGLANWEEELKPYYAIANKMLGASKNPKLFDSDYAIKELAIQMGKEKDFDATNVSVYFGEPGKTVKDPYFDGKGPGRAGCTHCGGCMTGCRENAKNSLDKNYLHLAQQLGAKIIAEQNVYEVSPFNSDGSEGYKIDMRSSTEFIKSKSSVTTKGVIFAGGVLGTIKLLLKLKDKKILPNLSDQLGMNIRTNNEALTPIVSHNTDGKDYSKGLAIGSILHTDENSHLEPCRYSPGSGLWRLMILPFGTGDNIFSRFGNMLWSILKDPISYIKVLFVWDWSVNTPTLLFMQTVDSTLQFSLNFFGRMNSSISTGEKPKSDIPEMNEIRERMEKIINGKAHVQFVEMILGTTSTAHILGGATMGKDASEGVIDSKNNVFGYKNMMVCDGSMISANPGVNPSLSITAIAELAMSKIPNKQD